MRLSALQRFSLWRSIASTACLDHRTHADVGMTEHEPFHLTREGALQVGMPLSNGPKSERLGRFMGALTGTPYEKM